MFFTAIALVAFMGTSSAKDNGIIKKNKKTEKQSHKISIVTKPLPCMYVYMVNYEMMIALGASNADASEFAAGAYGCCLGAC